MIDRALFELADETTLEISVVDTVSARDDATVKRRNAYLHTDAPPSPSDVAPVYQHGGRKAVLERWNTRSPRTLDRVIAEAKDLGLIPRRRP